MHLSDSIEQRNIEPIIREMVSEMVGVELAPLRIQFGDTAKIDVDGAAPDLSAFVEIFAHQGRLRGAQYHKVARDALKLITLRREYPNSRLIIVFADPEAARCVEGKSWLAEALRLWEIDVLAVELDDEARAALRLAQARQVMVNPEN